MITSVIKVRTAKTSSGLCCSLRNPISQFKSAASSSEGWASISDVPIPADISSDMVRIAIDEEGEDDGGVWQVCQDIPEPIEPTREQRERHNLTHMPYRSWCPHCVAARRTAQAHKLSKDDERRMLPLPIFDYAFV